MTVATVFVFLFYAYLAIGLVFAVWFVTSGVNRLDESMRHSPKGVRVLLVPGSVLLWVVLLKKCLKISR
jgi:uncharacterized membrane protein HdeD (DUF308 family)